MPLDVQIRRERKIVEIWLSRAEQDDPEIRREVEALSREHGRGNYTVAVFLSGGEDLCQQTRGLVRHNRECAARREIQAQKQAPAM